MTYMPGRQAFRLPTPITDTLAIETHRKFRPSVTPAPSVGQQIGVRFSKSLADDVPTVTFVNRRTTALSQP